MTQELQTGPAQAPNEVAIEAKPKTTRTPTAGRMEKSKTKSGTLIALLSRPRGATLDEMMKATGWQAHSVRGVPCRHAQEEAGPPGDLGSDREGPHLPRAGRTVMDAELLQALQCAELQELRAEWERRYGTAPRLRSPDLLRRILAWRIQAAEEGGLDRPTRRMLAGSRAGREALLADGAVPGA